MATPTIFQYHNASVSFIKNEGGTIMVSATDMARPYHKDVSQFLMNQQTKAFISALEAKLGNPSLEIQRGGNAAGTWMHELLALKFAAWLSPDFELWMMERIRELMTHGITATTETLEQILSNPDLIIGMAQELKKERAEKELIEESNRLLQLSIKEQAPKVQYVNEVLQSTSTYCINQIAKELGTAAPTLNKELKRLGIQYKQNGTWLLTAKYQDKGYTSTKTYAFTDGQGATRTSMSTVWTEAGRKFIHAMVNPKLKAA